jgi:hypothetical protein
MFQRIGARINHHNNFKVSLSHRLGYEARGLKLSYRDQTMKISKLATVALLSTIVVMPTQAGAGWGKDKHYKSERSSKHYKSDRSKSWHDSRKAYKARKAERWNKWVESWRSHKADKWRRTEKSYKTNKTYKTYKSDRWHRSRKY